MSLSKVAVDEAAKKYWEEFYKEYGKSWVREIPRKIKTAMAEGKRVAAADIEPGRVFPIARAVTPKGVVLEGLFETQAGAKLVFQAAFDGEGNVVSFSPIELAASASKPSKSKASKSKSSSK